MREKVWGGMMMSRATGKWEQRRVIVRARSQKEAAKMAGVSLHEFRGYWGETGNKLELEVADRVGMWVEVGERWNNPAYVEVKDGPR